jgi:predicted nucleic acid-binding protein
VPYLLDTNVLSELRKGMRGDERVRAWAKSVSGERHFVSVLSLGEIRKGIERLRRTTPEKCAVFEQWLGRLAADYGGDILELTRSSRTAGDASRLFGHGQSSTDYWRQRPWNST